jgi:hypothetical protein
VHTVRSNIDRIVPGGYEKVGQQRRQGIVDQNLKLIGGRVILVPLR